MRQPFILVSDLISAFITCIYVVLMDPSKAHSQSPQVRQAFQYKHVWTCSELPRHFHGLIFSSYSEEKY